MTNSQRVDAVLSVIEDITPEEHKPQVLRLASVIRHDYPESEQLRMATGILYDGLAYGNWPWVSPAEPFTWRNR